jgi:hypothetical protein
MNNGAWHRYSPSGTRLFGLFGVEHVARGWAWYRKRLGSLLLQRHGSGKQVGEGRNDQPVKLF